MSLMLLHYITVMHMPLIDETKVYDFTITSAHMCL